MSRGRNTDDVDLIISVPDRRLEPEVTLADPGSPSAMSTYKQRLIKPMERFRL